MSIVNGHKYLDNEAIPPVEFEQNGNVIPIDKSSVIKYIFACLNDYDIKKFKGIDTSNQANPYQDKLIMPLENGKFISVPEDLHKFAVEKWLESNSNTNDNNNTINNNVSKNNTEEDDGIIIHANDCKCKDCAGKKNKYDNFHYLKIFICVLIVMLLIYFIGSSCTYNKLL